jgi:hypothetical protein
MLMAASTRDRPPPRRGIGVLLWLSFVVWLGGAGVGMLALGLEMREASAGSLACEAKAGDSNYGQSEWSWFPLGLDCTWTRQSNGFDAHDRAGWGLTAYMAGVVALGAGIGYAIVWYSRARVGLA